MRTASAPLDPGPNLERAWAAPGSPQLSRRTLLRGALCAGATVAVVGTGGLSYRVFDAALLDPVGGAAFEAWTHWRDDDGPLGAVAAAVLAANPHNSQPWRFVVTSQSIDVYADPGRGTGTLDPLRRELHVGLGCALENLLLGAEARGLSPELALLPDGAAGLRVAHVDLGRGTPRPSGLYEAIGDRHTDRGPFLATVVPDPVLASLGDTAGLTDVAVTWVVDAAERHRLGELMVSAAIAITDDEQQSRDSFVWFRPDDDAVQQNRDGLTLDGQGFSPLKLSLAKLLPEATRTSGDQFWVDQTREVHTATAAAYGVITVTDATDVRSRLVGGRLLERIHLQATERGVALHHMNQITERIDRERSTAAPPEFANRFSDFLPPSAAPLAAFRVGYPVGKARPSPRRALSEVTG